MKILSTLVIITCLPFITLAQLKEVNANDSLTAELTQKDTSYWVYNLREFRDAIYQQNKAKAKLFADFPIMNENNEIWYLAYRFSGKLIEKLPKDIKPFTEQDFDKYFEEIFTPYFVKCFLKIKTDELYKKGSFTTVDLLDSVNSRCYYMSATVISQTNTIELILNSKPKNPDDDFELSVGYFIDINKQGHLKLKKVRVAG